MQKYCCLILLSVGLCLPGMAQVGLDANPDLKSKRECMQNIAAWLNVPEIKKSPGLMEDLADCYAKTEDHEAAARWYADALAQGNRNPDCQRKYALSLRAVGRYDDAIAHMRSFMEISGPSEAAHAFVQQCQDLNAQRLQDGRYEIARVSQLSSRQSEVVACRHGHEVYFYSRSSRRALGRARSLGSAKRAFSLYAVPQSSLANRRHVRTVSRTAHTGETELGIVWDQSCSDYYVVKCEQTPSGPNPPAIYRSWLDRNGEVHEEKLELNNSIAASNFHPAISPDGRILVFVSTREGGLGGTDLYWCYRAETTWSEPENLGALVNTVRDESYPSFSADGKLFFATNGYNGFGKRDIYYSQRVHGEWTAALNVGGGINSVEDDFAIVWNPGAEGSTGYFVSNRADGFKDEIYSFTRFPEVVGWVKDAASQSALPGAEVTLSTIGGDQVRIAVDAEGAYAAFIDAGRSYYIEASAEGYETKSWEFNAAEIAQGSDLQFDLELDPLQSCTIQGTLADAKTGVGLEQVTMRVVNGQTGEILWSDGPVGAQFDLTLDAGADYVLLFQKSGYNSVALHLPLSELQGRKLLRQDLQMTAGTQILMLGMVTDSQGHRLSGTSRIDVVDMASKAILQSTTSDGDGRFSFLIDRNLLGTYRLFVSHDGEQTTHVNVLASDDQYFPISLEPAKFSLEFAANILHYDYAVPEATQFSHEALDDIYFFLLQHPDVHVEMRTYCDARGDSLANIALAKQRSAAIVSDLLLRGGITADRLHRIDFGESKPVNECVDGVDCPEEKHAENRRTEVYFFKPAQALR